MAMQNPVRPKDFIAPILMWALVLTGCVFGQGRTVDPPAAVARQDAGPGPSQGVERRHE